MNENVKLAYLCAKDALDKLSELPCRVDEMTPREFAIFNIAADLCGSIKFIHDILEHG